MAAHEKPTTTVTLAPEHPTMQLVGLAPVTEAEARALAEQLRREEAEQLRGAAR